MVTRAAKTGQQRNAEAAALHAQLAEQVEAARFVTGGWTVEVTSEASPKTVAQAVEILKAHHAGPGSLSETDVLTLARVAKQIESRDQMWTRIGRSNAGAHAETWRMVATHTASSDAAGPYSLAAFGYWLTGDGASASICIEQALDADPAYPMGRTGQNGHRRRHQPRQLERLRRLRREPSAGVQMLRHSAGQAETPSASQFVPATEGQQWGSAAAQRAGGYRTAFGGLTIPTCHEGIHLVEVVQRRWRRHRSKGHTLCFPTGLCRGPLC